MTLAADRAALEAGLDPLGLRVSEREPDKVDVPCFVIGNPVGTYDDDFTGDFTRTFPVTLLVDRNDSQRAIAYLDPFIDPTGASSVPAAINAVDGARCVGWSNFGGGYIIGDIEYAGVTWEVQMI